MTNLLQLGLSISVLCNVFSMYCLWKVIVSHSAHLNALSALVVEVARNNVEGLINDTGREHGTGIPSMAENTKMEQ